MRVIFAFAAMVTCFAKRKKNVAYHEPDARASYGNWIMPRPKRSSVLVGI